MNKQQQYEAAKKIAATLPLNKCMRVTSEKTSYYIFNLNNIMFIGYYDNDMDRPKKVLFKNKTVYTTKTSSGNGVTLQKL